MKEWEGVVICFFAPQENSLLHTYRANLLCVLLSRSFSPPTRSTEPQRNKKFLLKNTGAHSFIPAHSRESRRHPNT
eukprot:scaffold408_cov71-Cylindrotheca_fusiformis.AAC.23